MVTLPPHVVEYSRCRSPEYWKRSTTGFFLVGPVSWQVRTPAQWHRWLTECSVAQPPRAWGLRPVSQFRTVDVIRSLGLFDSHETANGTIKERPFEDKAERSKHASCYSHLVVFFFAQDHQSRKWHWANSLSTIVSLLYFVALYLHLYFYVLFW